MDSLNIDQALISDTIAANFGIDLAHENQAYDPVPGTPYAQLNVLANAASPYSLNGSDEVVGVYRIILNYPANTGAVAIKTMAQQMAERFKTGRRITYDGVTVTCIGHSRGNGLAVSGWYRVVFDVRFRAFLER